MINKIILKDVKKEYENFQLGELSFAIPKGYITGFIGKNGQGKTTTIKSILSFINFEGGILVDDSSNLKLDFLQRTGIVMDEPLLAKDWNMTIVNKAMAIGYEDWDTEKFFNFLKRFDIPLKSKVTNLSRGMKIKLMLSIALSHNANLLILDEPTSGLDPGMRDEFADIIQEFVEEEENTVLFSTHITQDLEAIADYIIFIDDGKLVEFKPKEDFLNTYRVIKGSPSEFNKIDPNIILGSKRSSVAFEALIRSEEEYNISSDIICENASIENIMVLYGRGRNERY